MILWGELKALKVKLKYRDKKAANKVRITNKYSRGSDSD